MSPFEVIADGVCPDLSDSATAHSTCRLTAEKALDALKAAGYQVVKASDHSFHEERADAAEAALAKVRELHQPVDLAVGNVRILAPSSRLVCRGCAALWPCPTVAALPPVDSPEDTNGN